MDPQSPPKRMTRARAAKAGASSSLSTATTAASRAKAAASEKATTTKARTTATATTTSAAAKKKSTRSEPQDMDVDTDMDELGIDRVPSAATLSKTASTTGRGVRGRPRKTADDDHAAEPVRTRGRPPKKTAAAESTATSATASTAARAAATSTSRATRTRKPAVLEEDGDDDMSDVPEKTRTKSATTRTRAKSTASTISVRTAASTVPATRTAAPKKRVTFEEPEKENIAPKAGPKSKASAAATSTAKTADAAATGLRAKPARRAAAAAPAKLTSARGKRAVSSRSASGTSAASAASASESTDADGTTLGKQPAPLSPRKVTQMRLARHDNVEESEDELGASPNVYVQPLRKSPSKPSLARTRNAKNSSEPAPREAGGDADQTHLPAPSEPCGMLASPARRPPPTPAREGLRTSPARRLEGIVPFNATVSTAEQTANKVSLLFSPAKRFPVPAPSFRSGGLEDASRSPFKMSLLQTPARRPASPIKAAILLQRPDGQSPTKADQTDKTDKATVDREEAAESEVEDDAEMSEAGEPADPDSLTQMLKDMANDAAEMEPDSPTRPRFSSRMSAQKAEEKVDEEEDDKEEVEPEDVSSPGDPMDVDVSTLGAAPTVIRMSPLKPKLAVPVGAFGLRPRDLEYANTDSDDSDDEQTTRLALAAPEALSSTPCPPGKRSSMRTPSGSEDCGADGQSTRKRLRTSRLGFTPLAEQLNTWKAHSPSKTPTVKSVPASIEETHPEQLSVDDNMAGLADEVLMPVFDSVPMTEEDMELVAEANDMSLMAAEDQTLGEDDAVQGGSVSEDGQEYGDENAIPIDPALLESSRSRASLSVPPVTPQRVMVRTFHTVSKVPLKSAAESTPLPIKRRRSLSVSRLPTSRRMSLGTSPSKKKENAEDKEDKENTVTDESTCSLVRNGTVISYSPDKKKDHRRESRRQSRRESFAGAEAIDDIVSDEEREIVRSLSNSPMPVTPAKSEAGWSVAGTPARTPRRDIDPALLRGAVVFVDVFTTDGADASAIFVELLTQMGAHCVKSWPWNPSSQRGSSHDEDASKVGITHVVFKDGGKQTLDKVRETGGVVQCVGVSWVLDCERENEWLDESAYSIDTAMEPRRDARRRKTMEPRGVSGMNKNVSTPIKQTGSASQKYRDCYTAPITPSGRRESQMWARTSLGAEEVAAYEQNGVSYADAEGEADSDWMLAPVPKTPAPETIARYAADLLPSSPIGGSEADADEGSRRASMAGWSGVSGMDSDEQAVLLSRTCPQKNRYYEELGAGILAREKDERVLMRLMSARRKSLQFMPKISSPLSRAWS